MNEEDVPLLDGWMLLSDVALDGEVTRQTVHRWAEAGKFKTLRRLGEGGKRIYVVKVAEAAKVLKKRGGCVVCESSPTSSWR